MTLKDYTNEDALDMLADLIEPASAIINDPDVKFVGKQGNVLKVVRLAMKKHPKEILQVLARIDGEDVETYSVNAPQMLMKLIRIVSDRDMMAFFGLAGAGENDGSFGSATANTEEEET